MLKMFFVTARDRARLQEISSVLIRYGLQDVIRLLGLGKMLGGLSSGGVEVDNQTLPERLRAALEALGQPSLNSARSWPPVPTCWNSAGPTSWSACIARRQPYLGKSWLRRSTPTWAVILSRYLPNSIRSRLPPPRWRKSTAPACTVASRWW